jgi:hypothetical protein
MTGEIRMLSRLETAYLGLLRIVILIAASLALIVAALGLASAVPPLLRKAGVTGDTTTPHPSLAQFIEEKKVEGTTASDPLKPGDVIPVDPNVRDAAANLTKYIKTGSLLKQKDWETIITKSGSDTPNNAISQYDESLKALTDQLLQSKGKPLPLARVAEMLQWHQQKFNDEINARAVADSMASAKFYSTMMVAGSAFLFFVLIVFVFLFVKIERSLRVVHTIRSDEIVA